MPKSFLTWSGGKQSLADLIRLQFPNKYNRYFEPFLGGGSVFLSESFLPGQVLFLGDINPWLIKTYKSIKDNPEKVIKYLDSLSPCREVYNRVKAIHPENINQEAASAHLIYLNKLCFGGMFRLNKFGYFNVPFKSCPLSVYDYGNLLEISRIMQPAEIHCRDFQDTVNKAISGDFIYFDPPSHESRIFGYSREDKTDQGEFSEKDYVRLANICKSLDRERVLWAVSDSNTSIMRLLLSEYHIVPIQFDSKDQEIKHLLITNYLPRESYHHESEVARSENRQELQATSRS